jgi:hypothetical protein
MPEDVLLVARCPVPDCSEHGKPHKTRRHPHGSVRDLRPERHRQDLYYHACGNVFAPTPAEKERIQQRLAQGTL